MSFDAVVWIVLVGLAILLLGAIVGGWMPHGGGSGASLTAFHAFQPKDKQRAVEVIIDEKAGKRWVSQANGLGTPRADETKEKESENER